jgi:predicted RNase H-like HicB family nuclease
MNSHYSMMIQWSEEDQLFLVHLPDFPSQQFVTHGTTYETAARNGQEVLAMIIEEYREKCYPNPRLCGRKPRSTRTVLTFRPCEDERQVCPESRQRMGKRM